MRGCNDTVKEGGQAGEERTKDDLKNVGKHEF
jgi:hypothetical protein